MHRLLALGALVLFALSAVLLAGCQRETTPPLIQVTDLLPREVEVGDRLVLSGVGFPEGKVAHVAFRGDLHRPGASPVTGISVDLDAVVAASTEIDIPFTDALQAVFAGPGDRAVHTTFAGEVTVAFAARSPGAPPVAGTLRDTWLDVRPPIFHRAAADKETADGNRTMSFLGIRPAASAAASGGILIESVVHGSPVDVARFLPGDVVTEIDGLRVLSARDMLTREGARTASLKIRRDQSPHEEVAEVSLVGLEARPEAALLGPVVVLGLAALLLLLTLAPLPRAAAWALRRVASRLRDRGSVPMPGLSLAVSGFCGASATFVAMALGHGVVGADLDVAVLFLLSISARVTVALLTGSSSGRHVSGLSGAWSTPGRGYSLKGAVGSVLQTLLREAPGAIAILCVVLMTGSLRLDDIVRAQGGWPWGWTLFRTPVAAGLWVAVLAPLLTAGTPARHRILTFAEWANLFLTCGLAAALFLGGWRMPGLAPEQVDGHLGLELVGSGLFAAKAWLCVAGVLAVRWALPRVSAWEMSRFAFRWLLPGSALGLGLTALWVHAAPSAGTETFLGTVLFGGSLVILLHLGARLRYDMRASVMSEDLPLCPFL